MRKLTVLHKHNIVNIMRNCIVQYAKNYLRTAASEAEIKLYAADVAYNCTVLQAFVAHNNCNKLQDAVVMQDTNVREEFVAVLQYVAAHELVTHSCV